MMKRNIKIMMQYMLWLALLLGVNVFAALLLWLADARAFYSTALVMTLATVLLFSAVCCILVRRERRRERAFADYLHRPDEYHEELLLKASSPARREEILLLGSALREGQSICAGFQTQLEEYEEYVESWAHETKTPLSLLTLLLDNRREELGGDISRKLDYIRNRIQESTDQMLFYARLKGGRKDYLFEHLSVRACVEEVLEDYKPLLEEKDFQILFCLLEDTVCSDRRGLRFLLGQLVSNSIKYCGRKPELCIASDIREDRCVLSVRDNGTGVRSCDLPYIFEKGFTGDSGEDRKKATGMGLYLAKEMARDLNLTLEADSVWGEGFEMRLSFPVVEDKEEDL